MHDPTSVLEAWNTADPAIRHGLLGCLFDGILIEDEQIVGYRPRADLAGEVAMLMEGFLASEREGFDSLMANLRAKIA